MLIESAKIVFRIRDSTHFVARDVLVVVFDEGLLRPVVHVAEGLDGVEVLEGSPRLRREGKLGSEVRGSSGSGV